MITSSHVSVSLCFSKTVITNIAKSRVITIFSLSEKLISVIFNNSSLHFLLHTSLLRTNTATRASRSEQSITRTRTQGNNDELSMKRTKASTKKRPGLKCTMEHFQNFVRLADCCLQQHKTTFVKIVKTRSKSHISRDFIDENKSVLSMEVNQLVRPLFQQKA